MTSDVPIRRASGVISPLPQGRISAGGAQISAAGREIVELSAQINQRVQENAFLEAQITMSKELDRIDKQYGNDPAALQSAIDGYRKEFLGKAPSRNRRRLELQYETATQPMVVRANRKHERRVNEEAQRDAILGFDEINRNLAQLAPDLAGPDELLAQNAARAAQQSFLQALQLSEQRATDGTLLLGPSFSANQVIRVRDNMAASIAFAVVDAAEDKTAALNTLETEGFEIQLPDGEGGMDTINVMEFVSSSQRRMLEAEAGRQQAEQDRVRNEEIAAEVSNLDLAIQVANTPEQFLEIGDTLTQNEGRYGTPKTNQLRSRLLKKVQKIEEQNISISNGSMFATGELVYNPNDSKSKEDFNAYYEHVRPSLLQQPPEQRNIAITDMVRNAKAVPDLLQGDIQIAARTSDPEVVTQMADLLDRIESAAPHVVPQLGSDRELSRIQMINDRINQGLPPEEAIDIVDQRLDPKNRGQIDVINEELAGLQKEGKIDGKKVSKRVIDMFDTFGDELTAIIPVGPNSFADDRFGQAAIDEASVVYQTAFEDNYAITRDKDAALKAAERRVSGQFFRTNINGSAQVMRYAPENYHFIDGLSPKENLKWMRGQMVDEAKNALKNSMMAPGKVNFKKDLRLVTDPRVTPNSIETGQPAYKLMLMREDGTPLDILGENNYFIFDEAKARKQLIEISKQAEQLGFR